ncbi:MAG: efflux RND transporter periplasmic adaptor subunit, partial [Dehalococcoidia bacterium]|nr:efflux RND transporter periplasmic adaptor subunit [Dehalococcoidia bacterium]
KAASIQASQIATVTRGSLQATASASGNAVATHTQKLSFGTAGTLGQISVSVGDQIKAGQVLAKLDQVTVSSLQDAVTMADASLKVAQITLDQTTNPYTAEDIAAAQQTANTTQANLATAQQQLDNAVAQSPVNMAAAQNAVTHAQSNLETAQQQLDNATAQSPLNMTLAQNAVTQATRALEAANQQYAATQTDPNTTGNLRLLQDQASYYVNAYNSARNHFEEGSFSQDQLNQAYSNMLTAQDRVTQALASQAASIASAQNSVAKAQDTLNQAQATLAQKQSGPDLDVATKQAAFDTTQATLTQAQATLAQKQSGPDLDVATRQAAVSSAQAALTKAQADLATKQAGGDSKEILKQQNQVRSAQAALDTANQKLQGVTITAPFDGTVSAASGTAGDQVAANAAVVTLLDPAAMRVDVNASETDIALIQTGQAATITFDALSNQTFTGKITNVAPTAKVSSGVVSYLVTVALDKLTGVKDQMTASATIVTKQVDNALLVPNRAIKTQGRNKTVQALLPDGTTETRTIQTGMTGDTNTEVTGGLQEGEKVVIPTTTTTTRGVPGAGGLGGPGGGILP